MPIDDLSAARSLVHRDGRFFRPRGPQEEIRPANGQLALAADGFLYFDGDPFPPGGRGVYRVGQAAAGGVVELFPGLVLDRLPDGARRFRIGYRYLGEYRLRA